VPDRTESKLGGKVLEPPQKYDPELVLRIVAAVTEYFVQAHRVGSFETLLQRIAEEKAKERRHKAGSGMTTTAGAARLPYPIPRDGSPVSSAESSPTS
jgi:hypothetical protein